MVASAIVQETTLADAAVMLILVVSGCSASEIGGSSVVSPEKFGGPANAPTLNPGPLNTAKTRSLPSTWRVARVTLTSCRVEASNETLSAE